MQGRGLTAANQSHPFLAVRKKIVGLDLLFVLQGVTTMAALLGLGIEMLEIAFFFSASSQS